MRNSFEVVFEQVPPEKISGFIGQLLSHAGEIENIQFSDESEVEYGPLINPDVLALKLADGPDLTVMFRARRFVINAAIIDLVLIRVVRYEKIVDVEISFDIADDDDATSILQAMHVYALDMTRLFSVANVYGGMEPAVDPATRYFTNMQSGPMPLGKN